MRVDDQASTSVKLILASTSPYRKELLERLKIPFVVMRPGVDESALPSEMPAETARRLARAKSQAISLHFPGHVVIGSDQVADWQGMALGKPGSKQAAREQLTKLSGQRVMFHTAVCVSLGDQSWTAETATTCCFRTLTDQAIERYIEIDNPVDTTGSAKAESLGIALMESMQSDDPTAIIGLPMIALTRLLCQAGLDPLIDHTTTVNQPST